MLNDPTGWAKSHLFAMSLIYCIVEIFSLPLSITCRNVSTTALIPLLLKLFSMTLQRLSNGRGCH